jgi:hypothetical protein
MIFSFAVRDASRLLLASSSSLHTTKESEVHLSPPFDDQDITNRKIVLVEITKEKA